MSGIIYSTQGPSGKGSAWAVYDLSHKGWPDDKDILSDYVMYLRKYYGVSNIWWIDPNTQPAYTEYVAPERMVKTRFYLGETK